MNRDTSLPSVPLCEKEKKNSNNPKKTKKMMKTKEYIVPAIKVRELQTEDLLQLVLGSEPGNCEQLGKDAVMFDEEEDAEVDAPKTHSVWEE